MKKCPNEFCQITLTINPLEKNNLLEILSNNSILLYGVNSKTFRKELNPKVSNDYFSCSNLERLRVDDAEYYLVRHKKSGVKFISNKISMDLEFFNSEEANEKLISNCIYNTISFNNNIPCCYDLNSPNNVIRYEGIIEGFDVYSKDDLVLFKPVVISKVLDNEEFVFYRIAILPISNEEEISRVVSHSISSLPYSIKKELLKNLFFHYSAKAMQSLKYINLNDEETNTIINELINERINISLTSSMSKYMSLFVFRSDEFSSNEFCCKVGRLFLSKILESAKKANMSIYEIIRNILNDYFIYSHNGLNLNGHNIYKTLRQIRSLNTFFRNTGYYDEELYNEILSIITKYDLDLNPDTFHIAENKITRLGIFLWSFSNSHGSFDPTVRGMLNAKIKYSTVKLYNLFRLDSAFISNNSMSELFIYSDLENKVYKKLFSIYLNKICNFMALKTCINRLYFDCIFLPVFEYMTQDYINDNIINGKKNKEMYIKLFLENSFRYYILKYRNDEFIPINNTIAGIDILKKFNDPVINKEVLKYEMKKTLKN